MPTHSCLIRAPAAVVITGYVLTLGGKIKLEPFANVVVNGKVRWLHR